MPILLRGSRRMLALASGHRDGELIGRAVRHLGWGMAHGSTTRGGTAAPLRLLRDDNCHINLTPDGPQGPRRASVPGGAFLASRVGLPVVCVGYAHDCSWRLEKSRDRFAIPRPYPRARAVFGPPLRTPPAVSRPDLRRFRPCFEKLSNRLTDEAGRRAGDGTRRSRETLMVPRFVPRVLDLPPAPAAPLPTALMAEWAAPTCPPATTVA